MNSKQAARYYQIVEAIAPVIAGQSSMEIKSKVEAFRQITLGSLPKDDDLENPLKPGHPAYDAKAKEFSHLCGLMVPQEVDRCGGTVAQLALSILNQTGRMVATHRKSNQSTSL